MTEPTAQAGALAESLKSLGLTKYEALVYIALLQASGATATKIHELSGVPRASVYPVPNIFPRNNWYRCRIHHQNGSIPSARIKQSKFCCFR